MKKLFNWSEISRMLTGISKDIIRADYISGKWIKELDELFLKKIPAWWKEERKKHTK
jgi:hypothetical protein